jgi:hypothetical protein
MHTRAIVAAIDVRRDGPGDGSVDAVVDVDDDGWRKFGMAMCVWVLTVDVAAVAGVVDNDTSDNDGGGGCGSGGGNAPALALAIGTESGHVVVYALKDASNDGVPRRLFAAKLHDEPITSLTFNRSGSAGVAASAGALIVPFVVNVTRRRIVPLDAIPLATPGVRYVFCWFFFFFFLLLLPNRLSLCTLAFVGHCSHAFATKSHSLFNSFHVISSQ